MRSGPWVALFFAVTPVAQAYPWMIRHESGGCAVCHVDPSGAGLLNEYGRSQQQSILPFLYGKKAEDVSLSSGLAYGKVPLPSWLNAGASVRAALGWFSPVPPGLLAPPVPGSAAIPILMAADLRGEVETHHVHAMASVGLSPAGASLARLVALDPSNVYAPENVVSREHWLGVDLAGQALMLRAGRLQQPFGLRNLEHPAWVRSETRTDLLSWQQHGAALAVDLQGFRAEVMAIAGNFQVSVPELREHGYSAVAEVIPRDHLGLGLSSRASFARVDLLTFQGDALRQAHGLFARWAPVRSLVVLAEADALIQACRDQPTSVGHASFVQADVEPVQGLHLMVTGETLSESNTPCAQLPGTGVSVGGWLSVAYQAFAYGELRVDSIWRDYALAPGPSGFVSGTSVTVLGQLHLSL